VTHNRFDVNGYLLVNPNSQVTYSHSFANNGPDETTKVVNGQSQWTTYARGTKDPATTSSASLASGSLKGSRQAITQKDFTVPSDAKTGDKFCQKVTFSPRAWDNNSEGTGVPSEVCVVVTEPTPPAYVPLSRPSGDYERGQPVVPYFDIGLLVTEPCNLALADGVETGEVASWTNAGLDANSANRVISGSYKFINRLTFGTKVDAYARYELKDLWSPANGNISNTLETTPLPYKIVRTTTISAGSPAPIPSPVSGGVTVYEVPYSRFYGNDIYSTTGDIFFNKNNPNTGIGGAVQYAAIAAEASDVPYIFTNISNGSFSPNLGANWASSAGIAAYSSYYNDIVAKLPANAQPKTSPWTINGASEEGYFKVDGDLVLNTTGASNKASITIYATGNVYITDDIRANTAQVPRNESDLATAAVMLIVANGNINIAPNVRQIDAILIAGGNVSTCASSGTASYSGAGLFNNCRSKLVINGAVGASHISFLRSIGSRLKGTPSENIPRNLSHPNNGFVSNTGGDYDGGVTKAAEIINFPPYLYFAKPLLNDDSKAGFQSIYNAAPLF